MPRKPASHDASATPVRRRGRPQGSGVAAATRERILRAAVYRFAQSGYAQTSNQDIARAAGITSGSLYHYFDSKAALFHAALRHTTVSLLETYRGACRDAAGQSVVDQLCLGLERVIALARDWPGIVRFGGNAAAEIRHNRELDWLDSELAAAFPDFFRDLVRQAARHGELASATDLEGAAGLLLALTMGLSISHDTDGDEEAFAARVRAYERLLRGELFQGKHLRK